MGACRDRRSELDVLRKVQIEPVHRCLVTPGDVGMWIDFCMDVQCPLSSQTFGSARTSVTQMDGEKVLGTNQGTDCLRDLYSVITANWKWKGYRLGLTLFLDIT